MGSNREEGRLCALSAATCPPNRQPGLHAQKGLRLGIGELAGTREFTPARTGRGFGNCGTSETRRWQPGWRKCAPRPDIGALAQSTVSIIASGFGATGIKAFFYRCSSNSWWGVVGEKVTGKHANRSLDTAQLRTATDWAAARGRGGTTGGARAGRGRGRHDTRAGAAAGG